MGADVRTTVSPLCPAESTFAVLAYLLELGEGEGDKACVRFFESGIDLSPEFWGQSVTVFRSTTSIFNLFCS